MLRLQTPNHRDNVKHGQKNAESVNALQPEKHTDTQKHVITYGQVNEIFGTQERKVSEKLHRK